MVSNEEIKRMLDQKRRGIKPKDEQLKESGARSGNKKECPDCGTNNPSSAQFCIGCGADLSKKEDKIKNCPSCGYRNPEKAKFCVKCGEKLEEPSLSEPSTPLTEKHTDLEEQSKKYKICPNCQNRNPQDAKFCVVCGNTFKDDEQPETSTSKSLQTIPPQKTEESEPPTSSEAREVKEELKKEDEESESVQPPSSAPPHEVPAPEEPLPEHQVGDIDPVERIKKAKELLDIGAITQEDFEKIKNKYLEEI